MRTLSALCVDNTKKIVTDPKQISDFKCVLLYSALALNFSTPKQANSHKADQINSNFTVFPPVWKQPLFSPQV